MNIREDILAAARGCVCGERLEDYGQPEDNFATIATMWNAYLKGREYVIEARDVPAMMALLKIARISTGARFTLDNWVDLAGYAACGGELDHTSTTRMTDDTIKVI